METLSRRVVDMNGGDGLAPARPVASAKEDLAGPTSRRDEDAADRWRPVGARRRSASGKERGTASSPGLRDRWFPPEPGAWDGLEAQPEAARVNQRR